MFFSSENLKEKFAALKPCLMKTVTHGLQGYVFGSMVGIFTEGKRNENTIDFVKKIHENGVTFAKVGAVYAGTESILETIRNEKCVWNSVTSGVVAGILVGKGNKMLSGIGFGIYSGLTDYYSAKEE
ncbi:Mitochondrial import inner membrane translocase subunit tim22 [Binucleata daphniae]